MEECEYTIDYDEKTIYMKEQAAYYSENTTFGTVTYAAHGHYEDGTEVTVYWTFDAEDIDTTEDLGSLNWDDTIDKVEEG